MNNACYIRADNARNCCCAATRSVVSNRAIGVDAGVGNSNSARCCCGGSDVSRAADGSANRKRPGSASKNHVVI